MVFTLHRYILRELLRVFFLTAVALTVMLSLGSILRPVQEYGVGPRQVVALMGYLLPVTLTFVLPIAALLAGSLVYGRFAVDNELDACRASGISLMTLVYPGLALAIAVAIANLMLSFHVMPVFVHRAEQSFKDDAKQILFRNIQRQGYYRLPPDSRYVVYADVADLRNDTLSGVVVVEVENGLIKKTISAEHAKVVFNPQRRFNEVQITAHNTYHMDPDGGGAFAEWLSVTTEFGSLLGDDIKFKKLDEMKRIRDVDLMLFDPIARLALRTYAQLTAEVLAQDIRSKTGGPESTERAWQGSRGLYVLHSGQKFVEFAADRCSVSPDNEEETELAGNVMVAEYDAVVEADAVHKKLVRTYKCQRALIHVEQEDIFQTLTLELRSPTWKTANGGEETAWSWIRIRGLVVPPSVEAATSRFRTERGLRAEALASGPQALHTRPSEELTQLQKRLQREIRKTLADIQAETHSRLVFGIGCISMIAIGIGLGIVFKGGHLLSAFGASCIPAAVLIVCIMMGRNIATNLGSQAVSGTFLMWSGLTFLTLMAVLLYHRLLRN